MKKVLFTAFIVSASIGAAIAQDQKGVASASTTASKESAPKSPEAQRAQEWQNLVATELKLTDDQKKKIAEMDQAFGERRKAIVSNTEIEGPAKREKIMALYKEKEEQFNQLLTAEQQTKYKALVEARMQQAPKKEN